MVKFSIQESMTAVHQEIEMLLNIAVDGFGLSHKKCLETFNNFESALLKHIDIEEQIIFASVDLGDFDIQQTIRRLCDEHTEMKSLILEAKEDLINDKIVDIVKFMSLLKSHQAVEDKILYPQLDKIMSPEEKSNIQKKLDKE